MGGAEKLRMPAVRVVIPIYNGERYLREALESVFAQTYRDYEVICVNDGSTDGSPAVLREYGTRVTVVQQANAGQGAARNTGARHAAGREIAFLEPGDWLYSHKLSQHAAAFQAGPSAVVVAFDSGHE